jgi:hypothetical protein
MCEKGSIFQWNDECEQAFIRLKDGWDFLISSGSQFFSKFQNSLD